MKSRLLVLIVMLFTSTGCAFAGIGAGIGLHMGWVCVIKATAKVTHQDPAAPWSFLVSDFDGFTGWLVAGWSCAILLALCLARGRFSGWRIAAPEFPR